MKYVRILTVCVLAVLFASSSLFAQGMRAEPKKKNPFASQLKRIERLKEDASKAKDKEQKDRLNDKLKKARESLDKAYNKKQDEVARKVESIEKANEKLEKQKEETTDEKKQTEIQGKLDKNIKDIEELNKESTRLTAWYNGEEPEEDKKDEKK